jgi:TIR domain-containing protein
VPGIFICYRRDDSAGHAGRLRDALAAEFGPDQIFRDLDTIRPGDDFVQAMSGGIASCQVFLAVIGRNWLTSTAAGGGRRLDDPSDHVRAELAEALRRGVRVIPVLVQRAPMPSPAELPESIRTLADRNAIELDDDGWQSDVRRLVEAIRREVGGRTPAPAPSTRPSRGRWVAVLVGLAVLALAIAVFNRLGGRTPSSGGTERTPGRSTATGGRGRAAGSNGFVAETKATLPRGDEAAVGSLVYELVEASVGARGHERALSLRIRVTNRGRYDANFWDANFRLQIGGEAYAPDSGLNEIVAAESTRENSVMFPLPASASAATLRITNGGETGEIPLDLSGRRAVTPEQTGELPRTGKRAIDVTIAPSFAQLRFGSLACELRSASLHRYANKSTLTLNVRARNAGGYDAEFGDGHFRLVLGNSVRPPVSGVSTVVPHGGTLDSAIVFDVPLDASDVVLRMRFGDVSRDVPLKLPL